jgi:hypothetical protein
MTSHWLSDNTPGRSTILTGSDRESSKPAVQLNVTAGREAHSKAVVT